MESKTYQNPVLRGMYPDPSIVRVDETFYMVNSTFEYYPGIAISKSTDLINWEKLPGIAIEPNQADLRAAKSNEGIFAVCIRYYEGYFYVITTNFAEFKNFIIRGAFSADKQSIIWETNRTTIDIMGIDPDLYFENGRVYVQFTGYIDQKGTKAIQQVEINLQTGAILRGPEVLSFGTGGRDVEGPHIIKRNGYYYLLAAEGGTGQGHMITMMRGKDLWGPFDEFSTENPLFTNRDRAQEPLQNIGHADLFQDQYDNWWVCCLGTRPTEVGFTKFTNLGRETLMYPVLWEGDWPVIYNGIPTMEVDLNDFPNHAKIVGQQKFEAFVDNFESDSLDPEWITLRASLNGRLRLENGKISLNGSEKNLYDVDTPTFLAVRQTEIEETFIVQVSTESEYKNGAAGIAVVINSDHHGALLVKQEGTEYSVYKRVKVLDIEIDENIGTLKYLPEEFKLENTKETKRFSVSNAKECLSFSVNAMHFSNEAIAALNTGDVQGLYVLGNATLVVKQVERKR